MVSARVVLRPGPPLSVVIGSQRRHEGNGYLHGINCHKERWGESTDQVVILFDCIGHPKESTRLRQKMGLILPDMKDF